MKICNFLSTSKLATSTLLVAALTTFSAYAQITLEEENGICAIEAEHFVAQSKTTHRQWYVTSVGNTPNVTPDPDGNHSTDNNGNASGTSYIEILPDTRVTHDDPLVQGESFTNTPGAAVVIDYNVYFNTTGRYYVWVRAFSTGSEDNGCHVGLDGNWPASGARMQWCAGKNDWTWESKQRTDANHCGEAQKIYLDVDSPGLHTFSISMREDGFEIDKIVLSKTYTKPTGTGPDEKQRDGETTGDVAISGELKRWHKVSLTFDGPASSETATPNPFSDYNMEVTFTHPATGKSYVVPGFFAACGDAEESSCNSGNKWRVNFAPDRTGEWTWSASFKTGTDVAINGGGTADSQIDGMTGSFTITESDKADRDHRAANKGHLQYVGEHYLRHSGTDPDNANGPWFFKAGADAPENMLAYDDFDDTPNRNNRRKSWSPHQQDYSAADASDYTWKSGKGTEMLGVVKYLSDKGVNAFSFLTLSLHGDDENVFPHLMKVNESTYNGYNDAQQWSNGVHHDRFDVSKLDQWEKVFEYGDKKGMFMHFKTMETENDNMMDGDNFGRERKLYYRELIARFSHHLALNWNLTEESTMKDEVVIQTAAYIKSIDPYDNHIVLHTYPGEKSKRYTPLLGNNSELTGLSLQTSDRNYNELEDHVLEWVGKSNNAGKKWVVCVDEPGNAGIGIDNDDNGADDKLVRNKVLWATFLSGGAGVEYYYGYQTGETDLTAEDHRSRDQKYSEAAICLDFFNRYMNQFAPNLVSASGITATGSDYVLAKTGEVYVVYLPTGGSTSITLPSGGWKIQWFNPRSSGDLGTASDLNGDIQAPNNNDWVAVISKNGVVENNGGGNSSPSVAITDPTSGQIYFEGDNIDVTATATDSDGTIANVKLYFDGALIDTKTSGPFTWTAANFTALSELMVGSHTIEVIAEDDEGATRTALLTIDVQEKGLVNLSPIHDAYVQGTTGHNTVDLRCENGNRITYLMFDLSTLPEGDIESASLKLTVGSDAGSGTFRVFAGSHNNWTETTINSTSAPTSGAELDDVTGTFALANTYTWDVAAGMGNAGQVSFVLEHDAGGNDVSFASKEGGAATAPQLVVKVKDVLTSVNTTEEHFVDLYPNPVKGGVLNFSNSTDGTVSYQLVTLQGESLQSGEFDKTTKIDVSNVTTGVYAIEFSASNKVSRQLILIP